MAYPMFRSVSFGELKQRLADDYGCKYVIDDGKLQGDSDEYSICYFERVVYEQEHRCVVVIDDDSEMVMPNLIRAICKKLKINPADFGLNLG